MAGPFSAAYDADGLRAEKTGTVPGGSQATTFFAYDGDTPLVEMNAAGTITAINFFGPNGLNLREDAASGQNLLYTFDPQGNTVQRVLYSSTAGTVGPVLDTKSFDAFGALLGDIDATTQQTETYPDVFGFGGQFGDYTDPETGLVLMTHRYYDPGTGRFINRDPLGYGGGINLYDYARNNPINFADPNGTDITIGPASDPWLSFGGAESLEGLKTGLAATGSAFSFGHYDGGKYRNEIGFGTSNTLAVIGREAAIQAATLGAGEAINAIRAARPIAVAATLLGDDAKLAAYAARIKPIAGYTDVVIHGTQNSFAVLRDGKWITLSHRSLAVFLRSTGYQRGAIRLISCDTGALADGVAKNLANKLGAEVLAPTMKAWVHSNGTITVGGIYRNIGSWVSLMPGK